MVDAVTRLNEAFFRDKSIATFQFDQVDLKTDAASHCLNKINPAPKKSQYLSNPATWLVCATSATRSRPSTRPATVRGRILDRAGRVLAEDRPSFDVVADFKVITGDWAYEQASLAARRAERPRWPKLSPAERDALMKGKQVYAGPMTDRDGKERVPTGAVLSDADLWKMDWFVKGVVAQK